jgi:hypothetical protein
MEDVTGAALTANGFDGTGSVAAGGAAAGGVAGAVGAGVCPVVPGAAGVNRSARTTAGTDREKIALIAICTKTFIF